MGFVATTVSGCGHSDEEMAAKQREIDKLTKDLEASKGAIAENERRHKEALADLDKAGEKSKELEKALEEYRQRAEKLAAIEARYRDLRNRLQKLATAGVKFAVRNNRMVVQLPGDLLFDSGKDELKKGAREVLAQVAEVIRNDSDLSTRVFQVAGHTDDARYPANGPFKDNWGLSLARARSVLLFLISPPTADKPGRAKAGEPNGGGLDPAKLSAAGYAETDPVAGKAGSQTDAERAQNRRVELVLQPNVDEMLNISKVN
jgi:chemotaxis protein MotB